jgi:transcriptional regulator with XRE-family HTH domain
MKRQTRARRGPVPDGQRIAELRSRQGLGQDELAMKARVSLRTLQRAEHGQNVSAPNLQRIASALNVTFEDLAADAAERQAEAAGGQESSGAGGPSPLSLARLGRASDFIHHLMQAEQLSFRYDVDPDEEDAELIAEMVRSMKYFAIRARNMSWAEFLDFRSEDEERIRQMGKINSKRRVLAEKGINVFWGDFIHVGDDEVAEGVMQRRILVVTFSNRSSDSVAASVNKGLSRAEAEALEKKYAAIKAARGVSDASGERPSGRRRAVV